MRREKNRFTRTIVTLLRSALDRVASAVLCLLKTALRPTTEKMHRLTALLLLVSVGLLAAGAMLSPTVSPLTALMLCLAGAMGLLVSGYAGTQLDQSAASADPMSGDFPTLRGPRAG
jgi:uncharacterized membrane protein